MATNQSLAQKLEALKTQLSETLSEIQDLELEQARIESEAQIDLDNHVRKIIDRMNAQFEADNPSNDIVVAMTVFNHTIQIISNRHKVAFCNFWYKDSSLDEIIKWAERQIDSAQFYQILSSSFDREELITATEFDQFAIRVNDNTDIQLSYDDYRRLVTLEIRTVLSLKDIEHKLNEESNDETDFRNISVVDENDYIFESIEMHTYLLDEMVDQIKAIKADN
jgi:hypothetical protein